MVLKQPFVIPNFRNLVSTTVSLEFFFAKWYENVFNKEFMFKYVEGLKVDKMAKVNFQKHIKMMTK